MRISATEAWSRSVWSVSRCARLLVFVLAVLAFTFVEARANSSLSGQVEGTVLDQTGASVGGASVVLFGLAGLETQRATTDQRGRFTLEKVFAADYVVSVQKHGFREVRRVLRVVGGESLQLEFQLKVASIFETVTVTPGRGLPQEVFQVPQSPVVVTEDEIARRYANILPQALRDVPGVHIQQTTSGQGSPFVRGLTGQQVLHLINGVRFNNSTFRPGANQYTALIEHDFADRIVNPRVKKDEDIAPAPEAEPEPRAAWEQWYEEPVQQQEDPRTRGLMNAAAEAKTVHPENLDFAFAEDDDMSAEPIPPVKRASPADAMPANKPKQQGMFGMTPVQLAVIGALALALICLLAVFAYVVTTL